MAEFEFDGVRKTIKVDDVKKKFDENTGEIYAVNLVEGKDYYKISVKKKDGTESKAYQRFKDQEVKPGDVLEIGYKAVPSKNINPETREPYVNNYVSFYKNLGPNAVVLNPNGTVAPGQNVTQNDQGDIVIDDSDIPF